MFFYLIHLDYHALFGSLDEFAKLNWPASPAPKNRDLAAGLVVWPEEFSEVADKPQHFLWCIAANPVPRSSPSVGDLYRQARQSFTPAAVSAI